MNTYIPTRSELEQIIQDAVADSMRTVVPEIVEEIAAKPYLTKEELKSLTGWSPRTIQNLRDTRQIPFTQHGKKILYPRKGIMDFLKANHIKPRR